MILVSRGGECTRCCRRFAARWSCSPRKSPCQKTMMSSQYFLQLVYKDNQDSKYLSIVDRDHAHVIHFIPLEEPLRLLVSYWCYAAPDGDEAYILTLLMGIAISMLRINVLAMRLERTEEESSRLTNP